MNPALKNQGPARDTLEEIPPITHVNTDSRNTVEVKENSHSTVSTERLPLYFDVEENSFFSTSMLLNILSYAVASARTSHTHVFKWAIRPL